MFALSCNGQNTEKFKILPLNKNRLKIAKEMNKSDSEFFFLFERKKFSLNPFVFS